MSAESKTLVITIITVGVTLGGLQIGLTNRLQADTGILRQDVQKMESRLQTDIENLRKRIDENSGRLSRIEGLLEGGIMAQKPESNQDQP